MGPVLERFTTGNSRNHTISTLLLLVNKLDFSYVSIRFVIDNRHQNTTLAKIILDTLFSKYLHQKRFKTKSKNVKRCTYIPFIALRFYFLNIVNIKLAKVKTMNTTR